MKTKNLKVAYTSRYTQKNPCTVPQIKMEGKWLEELGFSAGSTIVVEYEEGSIRIRPMTEEEYFVGGCTALLDAVGGAIHHIGNVHKYAREEDVPEKTLFVITTDGQENASVRYTYSKVKQMVERQKNRYGWEFLFLGANIDAAKEAGRFGIQEDRTANFVCDAQGTAVNYKALGRAISRVRSASTADCAEALGDWSAEIIADYKKRG